MPAATRTAKFPIGARVEHQRYKFRGVVFDVDAEFNNSEEWYQAIPPEVRPRKDQPFYHLFAVSPRNDSPYVAYVSEQNLKPAAPDAAISHPALKEFFDGMRGGLYVPRNKGH